MGVRTFSFFGIVLYVIFYIFEKTLKNLRLLWIIAMNLYIYIYMDLINVQKELKIKELEMGGVNVENEKELV